MITIDNKVNLTFSNMGLFDTENVWIHPTVAIDTYELIYVTEGSVKLRECKTPFTVKKDEMLLLEPGIEHGGTEESRGHTAFYWLHFYTDNAAMLNIPKLCSPLRQNAEKTFREIMHLSHISHTLSELTLAKFLMSLNEKPEYRNKLAFELDEYIRVHSRGPLTVSQLANNYGYSKDYLSRIYKREFGFDIKTGIIQKRLEYVESLLLNTNYTVKEIAALCGFEDENNFVKFFKYHESITPTLFRNKYFYVHMNNR